MVQVKLHLPVPLGAQPHDALQMVVNVVMGREKKGVPHGHAVGVRMGVGGLGVVLHPGAHPFFLARKVRPPVSRLEMVHHGEHHMDRALGAF